MRNPSSSSPNNPPVSEESATPTPPPCCSKIALKRGPWTPGEDELLANYIKREGGGRWRTLPKRAGLLRCGKSCRLRWMNYLRPSVKRGQIAPDEEDLILRLHRLLGNRWSLIAGRIPGRTDNEIKNYWNTHLSKKLISQGTDPRTHKPLLHAQAPAAADISKPSSSSKKLQQPNNEVPSSSPPTADNPILNLQADDSPSEESNTNSASSKDPAAAAQKRHMVVLNGNKASMAYGSYFDGATYYDTCSNGAVLLGGNGNMMNPNLRGRVGDILGMGLMVDDSNTGAAGDDGLRRPDTVDDNEEENINYCDDEVFSSFLNSLINEDMFAAQNPVQVTR